MALLLSTAVLSSVFAAAQAEDSAESYPNRSILMIVPFGPGGATDQLARITQKVMEDELGQPFTVQIWPVGYFHRYTVSDGSDT